ncbi:MAG: DegV family protein [Anaerolineae bacterium]
MKAREPRAVTPIPPPQVAVITDSSAELSPETAERLGITVVPLRIHLGRESFHDGPELPAATFLQELRRSSHFPRPAPPSRDEFHRAYQRLCNEGHEVFSLHISSKLSETYRSAREAAKSLLGQCRIEVVDSLTTSRSLGALTAAAAEAARAGAGVDDLVTLVRRMRPNLYLVIFADTLNYLEREGHIRGSHALLGSMLGIKPLLILEEGEIVPLEKSPNTTRAAERLFEFISEFAKIESMTIVHGGDGASLQGLVQRVEAAFPHTPLDVDLYGPALASYVGPGGLGVFVNEGMP